MPLIQKIILFGNLASRGFAVRQLTDSRTGSSPLQVIIGAFGVVLDFIAKRKFEHSMKVSDFPTPVEFLTRQVVISPCTISAAHLSPSPNHGGPHAWLRNPCRIAKQSIGLVSFLKTLSQSAAHRVLAAAALISLKGMRQMFGPRHVPTGSGVLWIYCTDRAARSLVPTVRTSMRKK